MKQAADILKPKTYGLWDFIRISFRAGPPESFVKILDKLISAVLPALQVLVTARFVDTAVGIFKGTMDVKQIYLPLGFLAAIVAWPLFWSNIMRIIDEKRYIRLDRLLRLRIVEKRGALESRHVENKDTWDLITRVSNHTAGRVMEGFENLTEVASLSIRSALMLLIVMNSVPVGGALILLLSVFLFAVAMKVGKAVYDAYVEAEKHRRRADALHEILSSRDYLEERSAFLYTKEVNRKWYERFETARKIVQKVDFLNFVRMKSSGLLTILLSFLVTLSLLPGLQGGLLTIGMFMGVVTGVFDLVDVVSWNLVPMAGNLARLREYMKDLTAFTFLEEQDQAVCLPGDMKDFELREIVFQDVSFCYPGTERQILRNCSFRMDTTKHYAFVGVNGAGKTTVTKLLTGMYDNYEGNIFINGKNLREYTLEELKGIFSVVYQDFAKYCISFEDNIKIGNLLSDEDERVREVMEMMGLDKTASRLEKGIHTPLGRIKDGGADLSGGEWQKLAIARSLYGNAKMRILDEPTAALDPMAESRIYEMFGNISRGQATIFITHRLGAARLADRIFVIDGGRVAEQGDHSELMTADGIYAEMFRSQKGWYEA